MNKQAAPERKPPTYHLPEVPEYRPSKLPRGVYPVMYIAGLCVFLLLIMLIGWSLFTGGSKAIGFVLHRSTPTVQVAHYIPTALPTRLSTLEKTKLQAVCPDTQLLAPPSLQTAAPTLDFCSPKYYGNVTGPAGSHLTLIATHIAQQPQHWALVKDATKSTLKDFNTLQTCITQNTECFSLPAPTSNDHHPTFSLYSWTWLSSFPTDTTNYYIVAFGTKSTPLLWSSISFTLASQQPPCITIVNENNKSSGDCTKKRSLTLTAGDSITISGSNWSLNSTKDGRLIDVKVLMTISCQDKTSCNPKTLPPQEAQVDANGSFALTSSTLPTQITGTYTVTASVQVSPIATPGLAPTDTANTNTIVANALTFGEAGDDTGLTLVIPAPAT